MSLTAFYSSSIYCPTCFHDPEPHFKLNPDGGMEICETCEHVYQYTPAPTPTRTGKQVWHISNAAFTETAAKRGYIMPGQKITEPEQLQNLPVGTVLICQEHNEELERKEYYPITRINQDDWKVKTPLSTYLTNISTIETLSSEFTLYLLELPQQGE